MSAAATAARWSRRWGVSSSLTLNNNRWLRPLSRTVHLGNQSSSASSMTLTPFFTQQASAAIASSISSSSSCWFSSDATAPSKTKKWSANIKRSKTVIQALEQLPSNLRFDARSTCIPLSIDVIDKGTTTATTSRPLDEIVDGEQGDEDVDTVIPRSTSSAKQHQTSQPSTLATAPANGVVAIPLPQRLHVSVHDVMDKNHPVGTIWLPPHIFGRDPIRVDLIKRAVEYQRNRQRGKRKALAKTISMVSGSGKKVRAQKRTGGARAGHKRPPHWRGGAVAHGPKGKIQDYGDTKLNVKVRQLAVQHVLSQKLKEQNLILVDQFQEKLSSHQTKGLAGVLKKWNIGGRYGKSALILDVMEEEQAHQENKEEDKEDDNNDEKVDATVDTTTATTAAETALLVRPKPQHIQQGGGLPLKLQVAASNIAHVEAENVWYANVYSILKHEKVILTLAALEVLEQRFKSTA